VISSVLFRIYPSKVVRSDQQPSWLTVACHFAYSSVHSWPTHRILQAPQHVKLFAALHA